jgi:hypothetical protein
MTARGVRIPADSVVRLALGLLLLAAAVLKTHQLATEPTAERGLLTSRWFLILTVEMEWCLALLLLGGLYRRLTWGLATISFTAYAALALTKALGGEASCGCFGVVAVNPWYTLALDVGAVAALLVFRPSLRLPAPTTVSRKTLVGLATVALAAGVPAGVLMASYAPARVLEDGSIVGKERFVVLEPTKWLGKPCPVLRYTDIGDRLAGGDWTVVIYHHDCPHCKEALPKYLAQIREGAKAAGSPPLALVELPPYAAAGKSPVPAGTPCTQGRMTDARDWFVETPAVLALHGGIVVGASEGDTSGAAPRIAVAPQGGPAVAAAPSSSSEKQVPAPDRPSADDAAKAIALSGGVYSFGFVDPKSTHKIVLAVPTGSTRPVTISAVKSECKCMAASAVEGAVEPGKPALIQVTFVAPKDSMRYSKRFVLMTNDPDHPAIPVRIDAAVGQPLAVEPATLDLGTVVLGERREEKIKILNRGPKDARLLYASSSVPGAIALVPRDPVLAGGSLVIPIVVTPTETGPRQAAVSIQTSLEMQAQVTIQVKFVAASGPPAIGAADAKSPPVVAGAAAGPADTAGAKKGPVQ